MEFKILMLDAYQYIEKRKFTYYYFQATLYLYYYSTSNNLATTSVAVLVKFCTKNYAETFGETFGNISLSYFPAPKILVEKLNYIY